MRFHNLEQLFLFTFFLLCQLLGGSVYGDAMVADHYAVLEFDAIPDSVVENIGSNYNIYYVHTSHGSQIMTGLSMLEAGDATYNPPNFYEVGDDLGGGGDTTWVPATRVYLNAHPECNMAMFSWCGGCSDNTEEGINIYLNKMVELEADYPGVIFIYMTGHLDGTGIDGNLYRSNNQIRNFCYANNKILFDFADIESYDPAGIYYPDETDACNWCYDWCAMYTCPTCGGCAHSHCFNCYLKGMAWWWMMARISDWQSSGASTCGDANGDHALNVGDAVFTINYVFKGGPAPDPLCVGDSNGDSQTNVGDAVYTIAWIFKGGPPPTAGCCD